MPAEKPRFNIGSVNDFYPTPRVKIETPVETPFIPGDLVKLLIGPATGKIGEVVVERNEEIFPDTLVGTDSHTPMVNGIGVVAWGVGAIFRRVDLDLVLKACD